MTVTPDPHVSPNLAITDMAVTPGTPLTLTALGVTPSSMTYPDVAGIAITSVNPGDNAAYLTQGFLGLSDWTAIIGSTSLIPGALYFLGTMEFLTSTAPTTGSIVSVGRALNATTLDINIKNRITL